MQLVCLLARWCQVREDLLYAFEKSLATGLEDPMRQAVADFLSRVHGGMSIDLALDRFQANFAHEHFRDLVTAIRFNFRHRGNLPALLEQLEVQMHRVEEEYTRRRLSNARDMGLTLMILLLVPSFTVLRLIALPSVGQLFLANSIGVLLLAAGSAAYLAALLSVFCIQRRVSG